MVMSYMVGIVGMLTALGQTADVPLDHRPNTVSAAPAVPMVASLMAVTAGLVWSFGALTAKKADGADAWQYLLWRSVGVIVVMELLNRRRGGGALVTRAFRTDLAMLVACLSLMLASVAFVYALKTTTAANTALFSSMSPLVAAVLAAVFLKERVTVVTVAAIAVAFVGLLVMVSAGNAPGSANTTLGNVSALLAAIGFGAYAVCIRSSTVRDWSAVLPGYASMTIALCAVVTLAHGKPLFPPISDIALGMLHGGVFIVIGTIMFNAAARAVPAAAMAVLAQTETVFAPLWVFLAIGERPAPATLVGGAIILGAVIGKALVDTYSARPAWRWKTRLSQ